MGKQWKQCQTLFWGTPKSLQMVTAAMKLKDAYSLEEKLWSTWIAYSKAETLLCWLWSVYSRLWFFLWSCMDVRVGLWRGLSAEELMLLNCGVGEDSWESLGQEGDPTSHPKGNESWIFIGRTDAEELKFQCFGHLMRRADSLEKTLIVGKIEGRGKGENRWWDG